LDGGHEHIRGIVPTNAQQRLLRIGPTTGALSIDRVGTVRGDAVEWRQTIIRGDWFSFAAEFSARVGYQVKPEGLTGAAPKHTRT
jgi:GntR family transcriptional regulator